MAEELKIVLSVDGADKVATALDNTSEALKDTAAEAKKAGDALNKSVKPGAAQATNALGNLSLIAQDAPFGFIGITNNINPMLESFQRLQTETGGAGAAIKAMVQGLAGPAGLGLAVGVASSLLVTFGGDLFKTEKEVDNFDQRLSALKATFEKVNDDFNKFVAIADKASKLNDINIKARFANEITQETLTRQSKFITISEKLVEATEARQRAFKNQEEVIRAAFKTDEEYDKARKAALDIYNEAIKKENELIDAREEQAAVNRLAVEEEKRAAAERQKNVDTIAKTIAALREAQKDATNVAIAFNTSSIDEQIKLIQETIKKLITKFNLDPDNSLILKLKGEINTLELRKVSVQVQKVWPDYVKKFIEGGLKVPITPVLPSFSAVTKRVVELSDTLDKAFQDAAISIGVNFGETLGLVIAGQATLGDVFSGIFATLADAVSQLGKELIQIGTLAVLAQSALQQLLANPFAAIAVGIALTALGTALKATLGKKNRFAVGTNFAPGGMALVGERGPELVNLPRGSQVVPAAQTSAMLGGRNQVEVFGVLRGQDIYFSNKKYSQTYNRQT
jgi:hypothetical protein